MPGNDAAKAAITALNGKEVYGRKLALSVGIEKEQEKKDKFQRPRREYRDHGNNQEINANRW
jgi:RNA recognition motif-containing protein